MAYSLTEFGNFVTHLNQAAHAGAAPPIQVLNDALGLNLTPEEVTAKLSEYIERRSRSKKKGRSGAQISVLEDDDDWE